MCLASQQFSVGLVVESTEDLRVIREDQFIVSLRRKLRLPNFLLWQKSKGMRYMME